MSLRILPLFLLHGDKAMATPQPHPRTVKGSPGPEFPAPRELSRRDVQSNDAQAALDWLAHVRAGRIGGDQPIAQDWLPADICRDGG